MGSQNEETLPTHPARSETKKVTDKEPTRNRPDPVRNTRTWMKTTSYGKTKQHLFVGLLLGVIVLSTQAQALSIVCCQAHNAQCESCKQGISEEEYCRKNPSDFLGTPGCEKYHNGGGGKPAACCRANNAKCLSCAAGLSEEEYCKKNPSTGGCEKYRNCCQAVEAKCESCKQGISEEEYCKKAPSDFFWTSARLREVQLLQGKQYQVPLLRRGHKRGRVLQEEPIFWRLRAVHLLPGSRGQVRGLQAGHKRGTVLQEEPTKFSGYTRLREVHNTSR